MIRNTRAVMLPRETSFMRSRTNAASGFTMIEVMIALMIIGAAALTMVGLHSNLQRVRDEAVDNNIVMMVGRSIINQMVAVEATRLGDPAKLPWSLPRFETGGTRQPLMFKAVPDDDSINGPNAPVIDRMRVQDLKVFIEYYRGERATATGIGGILDDPLFRGLTLADYDKFRERFKEPSNQATIQTYRLTTDQPISLLATDDLMIVRIVLTWEGGQRRLVLFTAKRKES